METFKIQTLSDNLATRCGHSKWYYINQNKGLKDLAQDPITIVGTAVTIANGIQSIFNAFGGKGSSNNRLLSPADWATIVPFHGQLYDALRLHLQNTIQYQSDLTNMAAFTQYFAYDNNYRDQTGVKAFFDELARERLASSITYFNVTIPVNQTIYPNLQTWMYPYITNFALYFYGQGLNTTKTVNTNPVGIGTMTGSIGGSSIAGFSTSTILIIGAMALLIFKGK